MLAVLLLRRIAFTMLALFRAVTLRSEKSRAMPWKKLLGWVQLALVAAGPGSRLRAYARGRPPPPHAEIAGLPTRGK